TEPDADAKGERVQTAAVADAESEPEAPVPSPPLPTAPTPCTSAGPDGTPFPDRKKGGPVASRGRTASPLKWHGGKHYLARRIVALMPRHLHYCEPFFGGGSV